MWGRIIIGAVALLLLAGVLIFTTGSYAGLVGAGMSMRGIAALVIGSLLTLAIGGGLMALLFYSARKGYDDQVQDFTRDRQDPSNDA